MEFPGRTVEPRDRFANGHFANQPLQVGFSPVYPGPITPLPPMVMSRREFLLEELRKEETREESRAREIAEKRMVEDEIRREMDYDRRMAIRRFEDERLLPVGVGPPRVLGFGERVGDYSGFVMAPGMASTHFGDGRIGEGSGTWYKDVELFDTPVVGSRLNAEFSGYREDEIAPLPTMPYFNDSRVDEGPMTRLGEIKGFERLPVVLRSNAEFSGYRDDQIAQPPMMLGFHDVRVDEGPMARYREVETFARPPDESAPRPVMPHFGDNRVDEKSVTRYTGVEAFERPPVLQESLDVMEGIFKPQMKFSGNKTDEIVPPPVMPHFGDNRVDEGSVTRYTGVEAFERPHVLQESLDVMEGIVKPRLKFSGNNTERSIDHIVFSAAKKVKRIATTELSQPPPGAKRKATTELSQPLSGAKRKPTTDLSQPPQGAERKETTELSQHPPSKKWCCPLCQVTTTSQKDLNIHLSGKKHQAKQAELNLKATPTEANASKHQAKQVEINHKTNPEKPNASMHQAMDSSSKKLAENDKEENMKETTELSQRSCPPSKKWCCPLCQVTATSQKNLNIHLNGKKHQAKQAEFNLKATPAEANASRHQAKQIEFNLKTTPEKPNASKHQAMGSSSKRLAENDKEENMQQGGKSSKVVWCKLCNLQCNSTAMMDDHLKGRKHKARLEGKGRKNNSKIADNETKGEEE